MRSFVVFLVAFIISIVVISFDIGIRIVTGRRHFFRKLFHLNTYTLRNVRYHKSQNKRNSNVSFFNVLRLRLQLRTPLEFGRVLHVLLSNRNDYHENLCIQYIYIIIFTLNESTVYSLRPVLKIHTRFFGWIFKGSCPWNGDVLLCLTIWNYLEKKINKQKTNDPLRHILLTNIVI